MQKPSHQPTRQPNTNPEANPSTNQPQQKPPFPDSTVSTSNTQSNTNPPTSHQQPTHTPTNQPNTHSTVRGGTDWNPGHAGRRGQWGRTPSPSCVSAASVRVGWGWGWFPQTDTPWTPPRSSTGAGARRDPCHPWTLSTTASFLFTIRTVTGWKGGKERKKRKTES